MRARTFVVLLLLAAAFVGGGVYWASKQVQVQPQAETGSVKLVAGPGCYGWGCNGVNPANTCADGMTVASKSLEDGLLELRYSPSCKSNWGRFTPWRKTAYYYASNSPPIQIFAKVTVWNPGGTSYLTAHAYKGADNYGSSWSKMVDGTRTACTGVELYIYSEGWQGNSENPEVPNEWEDRVWYWGPCG